MLLKRADILRLDVQQECPAAHKLVKSLRQVEKMFAAHEASYQQSLRALRKKIGALHNSTAVVFKAAGETPSTGGNIKLLFMKFFIVLLLFLKVKLSLIPNKYHFISKSLNPDHPLQSSALVSRGRRAQIGQRFSPGPLAPPTVKSHLTGRWADQL